MMHPSSRLIVFLLAGFLSLNLAQPRVQAQDPRPYKSYLTQISYMPPPIRIGPYVAPGATAFAVDPVNPLVVYDGTYGGGVYKTLDGGLNWSPASRGLPDSAQVLSLIIDPTNPLWVYAGLYYNGASNFASGVYRTEDGGRTWSATGRMDNPDAGANSNMVVVYGLTISSDGNVLYAGTRTKMPTGYTLGYGGVFKSIDHGVSWTLVNNGLPWWDLYIYDVAVDPTNADRVYAAIHGSGIYRSLNGGVSWDWANTGVAGGVVSTTADRSVVVDPAAPNQVLFGTTGSHANTFRSIDGAGSWESTSQTDAYMFSPVRSQPHHVYATTTNGSIRYSPDFGLNWVNRSDSLTNAYFAADPSSDDTLYAGGLSGSAGSKKSVDGGVSFTPVTYGISGYPVSGTVVDPANPDRIFASLFGWGVMATTDGGINWVSVNDGLPTTYIQGLALDPGAPNVMYALTLANGIYQTEDFGDNWYLMELGYPAAGITLNANSLPYHELAPLESPQAPLEEVAAPILNAAAPAPGLSAAVSPFPDAAVLVGTAGRGVVRWTGSTWAVTNVAAGSVNALLFDRQTAGRVWLGGDSSAGTLQVSLDFGANWTSAASGLSGRTVYALAQGVLNPDLLLAGTDAGVYLSTDRGTSWALSGLNFETVKAVAFHPTRVGNLLASSADVIYRSSDLGLTWSSDFAYLEGYGFLGVATSPAAAESFYFFSRYGGIVRVYN